MSRAVRLHPLAVILAVTGGTLLAGIEGAIIAVPLVAVINSVGGYLRAVPEPAPANRETAGPATSAGPAAPASPAAPANADGMPRTES